MLYMQTFVALDLETTGLDAREHEIIEIAAVRFHQGRPQERWSSLVRPRQPIPPAVTRITGIDDRMVAYAPELEQVLPKLEAFVGSDLLVGHNLHRFDLPFLHVQGLFQQHPVADTLLAAQVLLPRAPEYNLGALARYLQLPVTPGHRAEVDAEAAGWLFLALVERAAQLPLNLLHRLLRWGQALRWPGLPVLQVALQRYRPSEAGMDWSWRQALETAQEPEAEPEEPVVLPHPMESGALLGPGGPLMERWEHYEHREVQVTMAEQVADALVRGEHLLVEAGTGTGKSLAYLVPAALWAAHHGEPVVISTYTKVLQDQLLHKDLPLLREMLGFSRLRAVVLKGRRNYLCPRRLEEVLVRGPRDLDELRVLGRVLVWLHEGGAGDRDDLTLHSRDEWVWRQLNAEDQGCTARTCQQRMHGLCPFYRARQAAQRAHLVIVNHALLMIDALAGFRVLPEFSRLIVDEAHHLERAATEALLQSFSSRHWRAWMRELGHRQRGLLGGIALWFQRHAPEAYGAHLQPLLQRVVDLAFQVQESFKPLEQWWNAWLDARYPNRHTYRYTLRVRLQPPDYRHPDWEDMVRLWLQSRSALEALDRYLAQLADVLARVLREFPEGDDLQPLEDTYHRLQTLHLEAQSVYQHLQAILVEGPARQEEEVHWVEWNPKEDQLNWVRAPKRVDSWLQEAVWQRKEAAVLTSATLTVAGSFGFLQERLGLTQARTLLLPSPFDYRNQAVLYVVRDLPLPKAEGYDQALAQALVPLVEEAGGRTLVLFTSYALMERVARLVEPELTARGIGLLWQTEGRSVNALVEAFRQGESVVLFGTRSLWEGIDVPGQQLSVLVLTKLPFGVPDDPLHAARAEMYADPFTQYSLPDAVLAFRQGFGRLIRTRTDRGLVVVFDARLVQRRYGQVFLRSLPPCRMLQGSWRQLPLLVQQWLNGWNQEP